jgi:Pyrimidine dimer DNA glycosylase
MQTFLPYDSFMKSAEVLDNKRLGKQRVETLQILKALLLPTYGWKNHPATKMWRGFEGALTLYGITICDEWRRRGFKDTLFDKFGEESRRHQIITPPWFGDESVHASHRSNLLRKAPEHYSQFNWQEPNDLPYVWPVT